MATETSKSIRDWGDETFGEVKNLTTLVARARWELDELEQALQAGERLEAAFEAADVVILLHRLAGLLDVDLSDIVNAKMAINRKRQWKPAGDGTGGHVKEMAEDTQRAWSTTEEGEGFTLTLRTARHDDIPTLRRWDRDPTVIASVSDDPNAEVAFGEENDWQENIDLYQPDVWEYWIAEIDGRPIGAMQLCDPQREPTHYWGDIGLNLRALDIWIGEADARGKGYGELMMRAAISRCFSDPAVTAVLVDPLASNTRGHRFYQRLGFKATHRQMFGDDDTLVHRLTREAWGART